MKSVTRYIFIFLVIGFLYTNSYGDGKIYIPDRIPANIPYQRAFLVLHEGFETLILQSKYEFSQAEDVNSVGWVVPVPTIPELASVDVEIAKMFFLFTSMRAQPKLYHISEYLFPIFLIVFLCPIGLLGLCIIQRPFFEKWSLSKNTWNRRFRNSLILSIVSFLLLATTMPHLGRDTGVEIVKAEPVGIYDVKVIKGESAEAIVDWLKDNDFVFDEKDVEVFENYVDKKWCFVTAKIQPDINTKERKISVGGLVAPLILKFKTDKAIYPLALTSVIGTETEVLLYTLSKNKLSCNERIKLRHSGHTKTESMFYYLLIEEQPEIKAIFKDIPEEMIICKFKQKLISEQMKQDLIFENASDNEPYRETKIVW